MPESPALVTEDNKGRVHEDSNKISTGNPSPPVPRCAPGGFVDFHGC